MASNLSYPPAIHRKPIKADHSDRPLPPPPSAYDDLLDTHPAFDRSSGGLALDLSLGPADHPPPQPANLQYEHHEIPHDHEPRDQTMPRVTQKLQKPPVPVPPPSHAPPVPPRYGGAASPPPPAPVPLLQETQASPPVLKKRDRRRSSSHNQNSLSFGASPRGSSPPEPRGRSVSMQPPINRIAQLNAAQPASPVPAPQAGSRPQSAHSSDGASPIHSSEKGKLHKNWLPGGRSRSNSHEMIPFNEQASTAWILAPDSRADYTVGFLVAGEMVPELWNENGDVYVYLGPKGYNPGASFKVPAYAVSQSRVLNQLIQAELSSPVSARSRARSFSGRDNLSVDDAARRAFSPPGSPPPPGMESPEECSLFLPLMSEPNAQFAEMNLQQASQDLVERLIALRNLFAFLTGQPLVGTHAHPTVFAAFLQIGSLLREFDFTNVDATSFGEAVDLSFGFYIDQLGLADVQSSREKTIEALVLAEQMKSWDLYNEAFAHAVGKYSALVDIKSPLFESISLSTRRRLERAHLDLLSRQHNVNIRLEQFDFPSLFAGTGNSTSEFKNVRFKYWSTAFGHMRSFVLKYYKTLFGNWPPKASSKKNNFSESGLNRLVLKALYADLCSLYDLLVDRESVTPRVIDQSPDDMSEAVVDPMMQALRRVLSEFDHSSPPVLPPIPFDIPLIPVMCSIKETYNDMAPKDQARFDRNVQSHEWQLIMLKSHNIDTDGVNLPFLNSFKEFELKEARGKSAMEIAEQRIGYWLFLYVVLQSMPMLTVDAPGLQYTEGVEYFLCEPPQGNPPWLEDADGVRKMWYQTTSGTNVELSADVVMFSVEATYQRSHCWLAAKQWEVINYPTGAPPSDTLSPLEAPHAAFSDMDPMVASPSSLRGQTPSPAGGPPSLALRGRSPHVAPAPGSYRPSSIAMGLEPVNFEDGAPGSRGSWMSASSARPDARRCASVGNLRALATGPPPPMPPARDQQRHASQGITGSTFDSILQGMDNQKKDKKRGSFLPF